MSWWQKAFAIQSEETWTPSRDERELIDRFVDWVVHRRMTGPLLLCLEMSRPLNYVGSQALHFLTPFLSPLWDTKSCESLARLLERRSAIDFICQRLEEIEAQVNSTRRLNESSAERRDDQELVEYLASAEEASCSDNAIHDRHDHDKDVR